MSDLSFGIKSSKDFFQKLQDDYSDFCKDKTSSRIALNCAMTSWHLTEWIYHEYNTQLISTFPEIYAFQAQIKKMCPSLRILHDIANGTKHYLLTKHVPVIKETNLHQGAFSNDFSRDFDISTLDIELKDGSKIYFEDEIEKAVLFWKEYFKSL